MVRAANAKAAEAELKKAQRYIQERQSNQDFLVKQMGERESNRKEKLDEFKKEKEHILAETQEFLEWEKRRVDLQRKKNMQHRIELEQQIESKKPPTRFQKRNNEDLMSAEEVAMNWHLLEQARSAKIAEATTEAARSNLGTHTLNDL